MSAYEKLGIEIDVKIADNLAKTIQQLNDALGKFNPASMTKRLNDLETKIKGTFQIKESVVQGVADKLAIPFEDAKKRIEKTRLSQMVEKEIQGMQKPWADYIKQQEAGFKSAEQGLKNYTKALQEQARQQRQALKQAFDSGIASPWTPAIGQKQRANELGSLGQNWINEINSLQNLSKERAQRLRKMGEDWANEIKLTQDMVKSKTKNREDYLKGLGEQWIGEINSLQNLNKERIANLKKMGADWIAEIKDVQAKQAQITKSAPWSMVSSAQGMMQQDAWNRQAGTFGQKYKATPDGSGFVRASVPLFDPKNVKMMNELHTEALKLNNSLGKVGEGATLAGISLQRMFLRLVEFYSMRKVLFMVSGEFQTAYQTLTSFNQALHDTAAIANASQTDLQKMSDAALSIASSSKFTATQVMESMKTLAQAGVATQDIPDVARSVAMFATGSGSTQEQAVKVLTTAMNVWNVTAEKSGRISNLLTAALNASKLEVGDLSTAFNYLANQSALFGKSMEETTAVIATMANQGVQASTIGTSISQLMTRLAAPTPKMKMMLDEYGITIDQIAPRANKLADIVRVFENAVDKAGEKGVKVEHIMQSLEARVGRGFATLVQAGADKLELMEQQIRNTNAAAVAYNESMKGFGAQVNMLRQELVTTLDELTKSSHGALMSIKDFIQNLLVGLRSAEGQAVVTFGVISTALLALGTALYSHPIFAAIGLISAAFVTAVSKIGESNRKLAKEVEDSNKAFAERSAVMQRTNSDLFTMLSLVDKNKVTSEGYLDIEDKNKKKMQEIINLHPELFRNFDIKKAKYEDLISIVKAYNAEITKSTQSEIGQFNAQATKVDRLKLELETLEARVKPKTGTQQMVMGGGPSAVDLRAYQNTKQAYELAQKALANYQASLAGNGNVEIYSEFPGLAPRAKFVETSTTSTGPVVKPLEKGESSKAAAAREKRIEDSILNEKIAVEKLRAQLNDIDTEAAKGSISDYEDILLFQLAAYTALDQKYAALEAEAVLEANKKAAAAVKGTVQYGPDGMPLSVTPGEGFSKADAAASVKKQQEWLDTQRQLLYRQREKDSAAIASTPANLLGNGTLDLNSDYVEKHADKLLMIKMDTMRIEQMTAKTAEEVAALEVHSLHDQMENVKTKEQAYRLDLQILEAQLAMGPPTREQAERYDLINDKLSSVLNKQQELDILMQQKGNQDFWYNFEQGATNARKSMGTTKDATIALGEGITNSLTNSIGGMVNALTQGGNAWKNFRSSLAQSLKDIAAEIQKYIVKLLALYAVQKLTGLLFSFKGNEFTGAQGVNVPQYGQSYAPVNPGIPVQFRAEGGLISGGIPGRDSVPAMLAPGEFVVKASSVAKYGTGALSAINQGRVRRFAEGGFVGESGGSSSSSTSSSDEVGITIINVVDPRMIQQARTGKQEVLNMIGSALDERHPVIQKFKMRMKD